MQENAEDSTRGFKIVSLAPNITEIIYALDMGEHLAGRTDYCNYPAECLSVPSVGNMLEPDTEKIISLKPDIVIASSIVPESVLKTVEKAGIKTLRLICEETLDGTYSLIERTAGVLGCSAKGETVVSDIKKTIEEVRRKTEESAGVSCVYIVGWNSGALYVATGDTYIDGIITASGGINCASDCSHWSMSREMLLIRNPQYIIMPEYEWTDREKTERSFREDSFFGLLTGKIVFVDADITERQGVRTGEAVCTVAGILHPSVF